jgi:hypothetical protein
VQLDYEQGQSYLTLPVVGPAIAEGLFSVPGTQAPEIPLAVLLPLEALAIALPYFRWRSRRNRTLDID